MPIISICNNKGGEGKSTVTVGLVEFLASPRICTGSWSLTYRDLPLAVIEAKDNHHPSARECSRLWSMPMQ